MNDKPSVQHATKYLMELWQKNYTGVPPLTLTQAVVTTVMQVGYTRALVKKIFDAYIEKEFSLG